MSEAAKTSSRVRIESATLSYPHLFEAQMGPDPKPGAKPKFAATFVMDPNVPAEAASIKALKAAAIAKAKEKFPNDYQDMIRSKKLAMPFRDDGDEKGYPKGGIYIAARSEDAPGLVSRYADAADPTKPRTITKASQVPGNVDELYAGCKVRATVVAFYYNYQNMKKGISFALSNVQKIGEGTRLDNRRAAQDEFEADLNEAPAALDDITTPAVAPSAADDDLSGLL